MLFEKRSDPHTFQRDSAIKPTIANHPCRSKDLREPGFVGIHRRRIQCASPDLSLYLVRAICVFARNFFPQIISGCTEMEAKQRELQQYGRARAAKRRRGLTTSKTR